MIQGVNYRKNTPVKRHRENPNVYAGEEIKYDLGRGMRKPKKCRKTAWKRFYKCFPSQDPEVQAKKRAEEEEQRKRFKEIKLEYQQLEELKYPYDIIEKMVMKRFITLQEESSYKLMLESTDPEMSDLFNTIFEHKEKEFTKWLKKKKLKKKSHLNHIS